MYPRVYIKSMVLILLEHYYISSTSHIVYIHKVRLYWIPNTTPEGTLALLYLSVLIAELSARLYHRPPEPLVGDITIGVYVPGYAECQSLFVRVETAVSETQGSMPTRGD